MENLIQIRSNNLKPAGGQILIAEPLMDEFYFGRSVVLLIEHNDEGSFGLVMNKPAGATFNEVVNDFPPFETQLYIGGPVETESLYFIHTRGSEIPESVEIIPGLYWGGDIEALREMMILGLIAKDELRFFLGYSGWAPKQLEKELKRNSWVVSEASARSLIQTPASNMWQYCLQRMGPAYDLWPKFPLNPDLN
jgi:putative transcriptional regulator